MQKRNVQTMVGSKISCMGIIGDGCGGGREFIVENEKLVAYDEQSGETILLLEDVKNALSISKKACVISVTCRDKVVLFDLSKMVVIQK